MQLIKSSLLSLMVIISLVGCSTAKKADGDQSNTLSSDKLELNGSSDEGTAGPLRTVYFAFDSSELTSESRKTLDNNAQWLKLSNKVDIQVEGHADERGGHQYNFALGERRARSVRDYLVALGVNVNRVSIISYGKEKPVSFGHSEDAWSKNRRANFVVTAK